jgi:hypothetical protein
MNKRQIQTFVMRFLEAYNCSIIEKTPAYVTVKLSPEADKEMTGRPYYWSFVERTGAPPETMTYTLVLDPEQMKAEPKPGLKPGTAVAGPPANARPSAPADGAHGASTLQAGTGASAAGGADSILGRYFGFVPTAVTARVPKDEVIYGSRRLEQLFGIVKTKGRFVHLFEEPFLLQSPPHPTLIYDTWLCINYKVELACDRKRSEIHSVAIQLHSGEIRENFHQQLLTKSMSPRLPVNFQVLPDKISLPKAVSALEMVLEHKIGQYDHRWADEANEQLREELVRIESYYGGMLQSVEPDQRDEVEAQFRNRQEEINWQYRPRILVSVINGGLFHLNSARASRN